MVVPSWTRPCRRFMTLLSNISSKQLHLLSTSGRKPELFRHEALEQSNLFASCNSSTYPPSEDVVDVADDVENLLVPGSEGMSLDRELEIDPGDEHLSHLRTKLYREESELDPFGVFQKLYQVGSVKEVLDIMAEAEVNPKYSSQALVSIWDMQKLLFQLGPIFNPQEDILNKTNFVQNVKDNEVFREKILKPILENYKDLEDEPLCASILALKKMSYDLTEFEPLVEECLRRKDSLCLSGLSRLSVILRSYSHYGMGVLAKFSPLILNYVNTMTEDIDIRLVSILLRNSSRILSDKIVTIYIQKLEEILDSKVELETVTYCKIFLVLLDWGSVNQTLQHRVGHILASRDNMELMEVLSLQRFLYGPMQEPYSLVQALVAKNLRIVEEERDRPRIDLLSAIAPYIRSSEQKKKIAQIALDSLNSNDFNTIQNLLFPLIRSLRVNQPSLFEKYWNNISESIEKRDCVDFRKILMFAKNYLNFSHSLLFCYRNPWLERLLKKHLYAFLDEYMSDKPRLLISPTDFSTIFAFLVAFDQHYLDLKYLAKFSDFSSQMKPSDLCFVAKGVDSALFGAFNSRRPYPRKNYEIINQVCSILEEECGIRLLGLPVSNSDLTMMCRIISIVRKLKGGDSPLLDIGVQAFSRINNHDSREIREICNLMLGGNYFYPEALKVMSKHFLDNLSFCNPDAIERFMHLTYMVGWERDDVDFEKLANVLESHMDQLGLGVIPCGIALGFHRQLTPNYINNIFNVDFLDHIDEELLNTFGRSHQFPLKLRMQLCELNRIVCLDVPGCRLPWFHEKFLQKFVSQGRPKPTYLFNEVSDTLTDLLGEGAAQTNVCLSKDYYYSIDFVIKFDHADRLIKSKPPGAFSFYRTTSKSAVDETEVKRRVAILVLNNSAFTKNVRNLKGGFKLKQRHLEILGYQVITIDPYLWNSLWMSEPALKQKFLESKIFAIN